MIDNQLLEELKGKVSGESTPLLQAFIEPRDRQIRSETVPDENGNQIPRPPIHKVIDVQYYRGEKYALIQKTNTYRMDSKIQYDKEYFLSGINDEGWYFVHAINKEDSENYWSKGFQYMMERVNKEHLGYERIQGDILFKCVGTDANYELVGSGDRIMIDGIEEETKNDGIQDSLTLGPPPSKFLLNDAGMPIKQLKPSDIEMIYRAGGVLIPAASLYGGYGYKLRSKTEIIDEKTFPATPKPEPSKIDNTIDTVPDFPHPPLPRLDPQSYQTDKEGNVAIHNGKKHGGVKLEFIRVDKPSLYEKRHWLIFTDYGIRIFENHGLFTDGIVYSIHEKLAIIRGTKMHLKHPEHGDVEKDLDPNKVYVLEAQSTKTAVSGTFVGYD